MENTTNYIKQLNTYKNNEENAVYSNVVSRLGFNPTSKGRKSKIELKKTA